MGGTSSNSGMSPSVIEIRRDRGSLLERLALGEVLFGCLLVAYSASCLIRPARSDSSMPARNALLAEGK